MKEWTNTSAKKIKNFVPDQQLKKKKKKKKKASLSMRKWKHFKRWFGPYRDFRLAVASRPSCAAMAYHRRSGRPLLRHSFRVLADCPRSGRSCSPRRRVAPPRRCSLASCWAHSESWSSTSSGRDWSRDSALCSEPRVWSATCPCRHCTPSSWRASTACGMSSSLGRSIPSQAHLPTPAGRRGSFAFACEACSVSSHRRCRSVSSLRWRLGPGCWR